MSDYTTDQILDMIEALGGPEKLDLSEKDLSFIDLNAETIQEKRAERGWPKEGKEPPWYSELTEGINLPRAKLQRAYLFGANLQGAELWDAKLQWADLFGANLQGAHLNYASLQGARLQEASLQGAHLNYARLQKANLQDANLQDADLLGARLRGADLGEANLQGARLWGANLQGARLWGANLQGARLWGANLERVDLSGAKSLEGAFFRDARLDLTHLLAKQIEEVGEEREGDYEGARLAYLGLKVNFKGIGYYGDARWAHLKERRMERQASFPSQEGDGWVKRQWDALPERSLRRRAGRLYRALLYLRLLLWPPKRATLNRAGWAFNWVQGILTEYMEYPGRVLLSLVLLTVVVFPLLYWWQEALGSTEGHISPEGFATYIIFSLRTAVTLAFNDLQPANWAGKLLTAVQGGLGVTFFALLGYSIAKRIARD